MHRYFLVHNFSICIHQVHVTLIRVSNSPYIGFVLPESRKSPLLLISINERLIKILILIPFSGSGFLELSDGSSFHLQFRAKFAWAIAYRILRTLGAPLPTSYYGRKIDKKSMARIHPEASWVRYPPYFGSSSKYHIVIAHETLNLARVWERKRLYHCKLSEIYCIDDLIRKIVDLAWSTSEFRELIVGVLRRLCVTEKHPHWHRRRDEYNELRVYLESVEWDDSSDKACTVSEQVRL